MPAVFPRCGRLLTWFGDAKRAGVEDQERAVSAQVRERAHPGRDLSSLLQRRHPRPERVIRRPGARARPEIGKDAEGVPGAHVVRQPCHLLPRWLAGQQSPSCLVCDAVHLGLNTSSSRVFWMCLTSPPNALTGGDGVQRQHSAGVGRQDLRLPDLIPAAPGGHRRRARGAGRAPQPAECGPAARVHALLHPLHHDPTGPGAGICLAESHLMVIAP